MSCRSLASRIVLCALLGVVPFLAAGCKKKKQPATAAPARRQVRAAREPWPAIDLDAAGLDKEKLDQFANAVRGHGAIIRHDAVAYTWGDPGKPLDIASASKAVYSFLVLKAVEDGLIPGLDQPVVQWMPELASLNAALNHKDTRITWRHLINQTSCYGVREEPGTAFDYNDYQTGFLWMLIFEKLHHTGGTDAIRVLQEKLFNPTGAADKPSFRPMESNSKLHRLVISPLDLARFGSLFLHDGKWKGRQILSAGHVRLVREQPLPLTLPRTAGLDADMLPGAPSYGGGKNQDDHLGSYSQMWWLNKRDTAGRLLFPSAPGDAMAAIGYGGEKVLMVVPSLDLIISWNTDNFTRAPMVSIGRVQIDTVLRIFFAAVKK
ncbi:MAG: serine hydrolase [Verrucomicrobiaceae bacterium]|nr:serine hydrolase [Verrucomicrobiaceae bacterium]